MTLPPWPFAPRDSDHETVDALFDDLATSHSVLKPSDFTPRALVAAAGQDVADSSAATNHEYAVDASLSASAAARDSKDEQHE